MVTKVPELLNCALLSLESPQAADIEFDLMECLNYPLQQT